MNEHVIVVEDNRALAENIAELLHDEGLTVHLCAGYEEVQQVIEGRGFDLALVDIGLTGSESGLDLVPRLRRQSTTAEIVLMTGNATLHSALQAIRSGVYAYLPKPFDPEELVAVARRALAQVALKKERQALAQRLAASEALYRGVVETVEALILGLDLEGHVRFANHFAGECLGLGADALDGLSIVEHADPRGGRELGRGIAKAFAGEPVRDVETRHGGRGRPRTVRWTLTPLLTESLEAAQRAREDLAAWERRPRVLAVGIDITERMELEQQNAEGQAMLAVGTLTTSLAHEIRNPLNAAKLQLALLQRRAQRAHDPALIAQIEEPARLVQTEIERLSLLLEDFLSLARPRPPVRRLALVRELFEAVVQLKEPLLVGREIRLASELDDPELSARMDIDKLKQVLLNLVRNALDALAERGQGSVVLRGARHADGSVVLSVVDDGPGLAPELLELDPFKPFVTTKPAGTGLGLAIVKKIVAQHGGEVELLPRPEGGTVARFSISP